jgi:hypothetical protein
MGIKKTWALHRIAGLERQLSVVSMPGRQLDVNIAIKWEVKSEDGKRLLSYGYCTSSKEATLVSRDAAIAYVKVNVKTDQLGGKWLQPPLIDEHDDGY